MPLLHPASEAILGDLSLEFDLLQLGFLEMTPNQNAAQNSATSNGPRDLNLRFYREIGIAAVAAALEASARKPQKPTPSRKDVRAVRRGADAA
jgi:hypothetical protein